MSSTARTRNRSNHVSRSCKGLLRGCAWSCKKRTAEKRRTLRSFLRRKCSQIGPATARAPNRSQGLSNEKCTFLEQASPLRQEHRQRAARVLIGSDYAMRHFQPLKQLLITVHKRVKPLEV